MSKHVSMPPEYWRWRNRTCSKCGRAYDYLLKEVCPFCGSDVWKPTPYKKGGKNVQHKES